MPITLDSVPSVGRPIPRLRPRLDVSILDMSIPVARNTEVACSLFHSHPGHSVEPGALSLLLWVDGLLRGSKVFTGAKHLRE